MGSKSSKHGKDRPSEQTRKRFSTAQKISSGRDQLSTSKGTLPERHQLSTSFRTAATRDQLSTSTTSASTSPDTDGKTVATTILLISYILLKILKKTKITDKQSAVLRSCQNKILCN